MVTGEFSNFIGKTGEPVIMEVEKGAIKKFADAVDDLNPLYWDEEYAKNSKFGSIIAPPGFFGWPVKPPRPMPTIVPIMTELLAAIASAGYSRRVDGGIEFEFMLPVRAGDTLVALPKVADVYEREGKSGKMIFVVIERTYINQNGDLVAKVRGTSIAR